MIVLKPYTRNMRCDTHRCSRKATTSASKPDTPQGNRINLCDECIRDIAQQAPLEDVLAREDVQQHIQSTMESVKAALAAVAAENPDTESQSDESTGQTDPPDSDQGADKEERKEGETPEGTVDIEQVEQYLNGLSFKDLRADAKKLQIPEYTKMDTVGLRAAILQAMRQAEIAAGDA